MIIEIDMATILEAAFAVLIVFNFVVCGVLYALHRDVKILEMRMDFLKERL